VYYSWQELPVYYKPIQRLSLGVADKQRDAFLQIQ